MLILTALTTEGITFFNTALTPLQEYIYGLCSIVDEADALAVCAQEEDKLSTVQYKISAFIPIEEILQAQSNNDKLFCSSGSCPEVDIYLSSCIFTLQTEVFKEIDISLNGSDISPPTL